MAWLLLAHLVIPLIFGIAFILLAYFTGPDDALGSELVVEAALDLAILAMGATAAIIENPRLQGLFDSPGDAVVAGIAITAINLLLTVIVIGLRKTVYKKTLSIPRKRTCAFLAVVFGSMTLILVCVPVIYAYQVPLRPVKAVSTTNGALSEIKPTPTR